jgi:uncharacterized protein YecE (DUF72 family)
VFPQTQRRDKIAFEGARGDGPRKRHARCGVGKGVDGGMARFYVGTSGWNYAGWRGSFYPADLPARRFLAYYAGRFDTAEVNYSFYHLPRVSTYENWRVATPDGFVFALKASRFITHIKRLHEVREAWEEFVARARALKDKLGPILLQFPSSFQATDENLARIEEFLGYAASDENLRLAAEFRHTSCFEPRMVSILKRRRAALVIAHSARYPVPELIATAPFVYFRFHGPKELFASGYTDRELRKWAAHMKDFIRTGHDVYAYFNNDARGDAVPNAETIRAMVAGAIKRTPATSAKTR